MRPLKVQRRTWLSLGILGLLTLTACATPRPKATQNEEPFWSGRLGLQLQSNPPQNWSASFELKGSAAQGQLVLFSPIGTTLAQLSWTPQSALLEQGQERMTGKDLKSLSQRLTGTELPIGDLFEWLSGRFGGSPDWQVDLSAYSQGRVIAKKSLSGPEAVLRILLDQ